MAKRFNNNLVKPMYISYTGEGCQYQNFDKAAQAMVPCGKDLHNIGKQVFNVCSEHYDLLISLGIKPKLNKKKKEV